MAIANARAATPLLVPAPVLRRPSGLRALAIEAYDDAARPPWGLRLCVIALILAAVFPTDLASYRSTPPSGGMLASVTNDYVRYIDTAAQVALPLMYRDPVGMMEAVYVGGSTTVFTHGLKYLLDSRTVMGTRLGERPSGASHNMPSGHSSMASSAMYFVSRRYGWRHLWYTLPILLLTMYSRVGIDAHTVSAVIAGALVGVLAAMLFTGKRVKGPRAASD